MNTQNCLSDKIERQIHGMISSGELIITDHISCYHIKRCDNCPLQAQNCVFTREAYELKHYPELHI